MNMEMTFLLSWNYCMVFFNTNNFKNNCFFNNFNWIIVNLELQIYLKLLNEQHTWIICTNVRTAFSELFLNLWKFFRFLFLNALFLRLSIDSTVHFFFLTTLVNSQRYVMQMACSFRLLHDLLFINLLLTTS